VPDADPGWVKDAPFPSLRVEMSAAARDDIKAAEKRLNINGLSDLMTDILSQDLRNPRDKAQTKDGLELGFFLHDFDCHFSVQNGVATILRLVTGTKMHKKERRASPTKIKLA
jgi:hypothetical protein